jgi:hypothetical protein
MEGMEALVEPPMMQESVDPVKVGVMTAIPGQWISS